EVLWLQSANPARLFFSSDGRASELLVGCLVALMPPLRARAPVTVGALIAIVAFSLLHPQALFVPIVVGGGMLLGTTTALVIATVTERSTAGRILSWAPLRGIGLVSYGWYLWHVPVLSWASSLTPLDRWPATTPFLCFGGLSLLIAIASYELVERRFTRGSHVWSVFERLPPSRRHT